MRAHARTSSGPLRTPPIVREALRSPGRPLDNRTRVLMESRFGHDFGNVRVHADALAAESARAVNARAYAVGSHVVFNTPEIGLGSLAHELAHVVQQRDVAGTPDRIPMGSRDDAAEREAEQVGRGRTGAPAVREGACLRRQPQGDEEKKDPPPILHKGDWVFDPKLETPLGGGSLEDVNKGLHYFDKGGGGNTKCPTGWRMRYEGLCCPGFTVDVDRCCPVNRMTAMGVCCGTDEYADGTRCVKYQPITPTMPGLPGKGIGTPAEPPLSRRDLPPRTPSLGLGPSQPLTVSMDIYFKQNMPAGVVSDGKALRDSLTPSGGMSLDGLVTWLKTGPQFSVQLTGKASIEGPPAHNRELGEYRARSVANALAQAGVGDRTADPPGLTAACPALEDGIHNCGDASASKKLDEKDRQVRATLFIMPGRSR